MDSIKKFFSGSESEAESTGFFDSVNPFRTEDQDDGFNFGKYFELSYKNRLYGFGGSCGLGVLCSLMGIVCLFFMNFVGFGVLYSIGNICMILSTMFLVGPLRQFKNMFKANRVIATIIFIVSIILTLCAAFWWKNAILCIIFLIIQVGAFIWYALSYIPFAQTACCSCMKGVVAV